MQNTSTKTNRGNLIIAISVIVLLVGLGYLNTKRQAPEFTEGTTMQADKTDSEAAQTEEGSSLPESQIQITPTTKQSAGTFVRQGTLLTSDNPTRGNLMLKTQNSTFYLRTSRDYSSLLGKSVTATGNGTTEQFSLIDIIENK
ncbi:MAG: hypothetical protein JNK33_05600 [Candidatus Doudnabacteria bacterium]|nr:hypothetical protein [Candidatus Doudnabacteria bacterium]